MSAKDHKPTDWGGGETRCIWDHEVWPCTAAQLIAEVRQNIAAEVRSNLGEPQRCDVHAAQWQTRADIADEIEAEAAIP